MVLLKKKCSMRDNRNFSYNKKSSSSQSRRFDGRSGRGPYKDRSYHDHRDRQSHFNGDKAQDVRTASKPGSQPMSFVLHFYLSESEYLPSWSEIERFLCSKCGAVLQPESLESGMPVYRCYNPSTKAEAFFKGFHSQEDEEFGLIFEIPLPMPNCLIYELVPLAVQVAREYSFCLAYEKKSSKDSEETPEDAPKAEKVEAPLSQPMVADSVEQAEDMDSEDINSENPEEDKDLAKDEDVCPTQKVSKPSNLIAVKACVEDLCALWREENAQVRKELAETKGVVFPQIKASDLENTWEFLVLRNELEYKYRTKKQKVLDVEYVIRRKTGEVKRLCKWDGFGPVVFPPVDLILLEHPPKPLRDGKIVKAEEFFDISKKWVKTVASPILHKLYLEQEETSEEFINAVNTLTGTMLRAYDPVELKDLNDVM